MGACLFQMTFGATRRLLGNSFANVCACNIVPECNNSPRVYVADFARLKYFNVPETVDAACFDASGELPQANSRLVLQKPLDN